MSEWRKSLGREGRAAIVFVPLLLVSVLVGLEAAKSQASDRLSQSPISPVSPLPTPTPPTGTVALDLQSNPWVLALIVLAIVVVAVIWWLRSRSTPA